MNNLEEVKNFKLVKLVNGEDIICSIEDGNPNNNAWSNLTCSKKSKNRGRKEASRRKGSKRKSYSSWSIM